MRDETGMFRRRPFSFFRRGKPFSSRGKGISCRSRGTFNGEKVFRVAENVSVVVSESDEVEILKCPADFSFGAESGGGSECLFELSLEIHSPCSRKIRWTF
jgi:hypothetical protein